MSKITYFFATISPYTYLAGTRLEAVAARHGLEIDYKPFDLMSVFSRTGGTPPKDRHVSRQDMRAQELMRQAKKLGMPLNLKPAHFPTNMAPSSYAFISAQKHGAGDLGALAAALTRSVWADERDIAQPDVIADCLEETGFDRALVDKDLMGSADTYTQNTESAVAAGVFGAPFYITENDQRFWGQDRIEDLDLHLSGKI